MCEEGLVDYLLGQTFKKFQVLLKAVPCFIARTDKKSTSLQRRIVLNQQGRLMWRFFSDEFEIDAVAIHASVATCNAACDVINQFSVIEIFEPIGFQWLRIERRCAKQERASAPPMQ